MRLLTGKVFMPDSDVYRCMRKAGDACPDRRRVDDMTSADIIAAVKEGQRQGIQEWLDKKFTQFGKWSAAGIAAMAFAALVKFCIDHGLVGK